VLVVVDADTLAVLTLALVDVDMLTLVEVDTLKVLSALADVS
jgi:hypothetical protein